MMVEYNHEQNLHTLEGPRKALPLIFADGRPESVLDVGCGQGTWVRAALDYGISDVYGLDGVDIPASKLLFEPARFRRCDLTAQVDLGRKFGLVLCLEVAEHLDEAFAPMLVQTLIKHADRVLFSAACPQQIGQHHVNCQWPDYWQKIFNGHGFACCDDVRWKIWGESLIEPWYRQNMFVARRNPDLAGKEQRIQPVLHPDILRYLESTALARALAANEARIVRGGQPVTWYLTVPFKAILSKLQRHAKWS